jgi:hypothetical protein
MRSLKFAVLAGVAAIAVAGSSGLVEAQSPPVHVLTVQLPGGGVEHIRYAGDVAPQVVFVPGAMSAASVFEPASPFAMLDEISARMDRDLATLMQQAQAMALQPLPGPDQLTPAVLRNLPPGTMSYSFVSTISGNGVCTRTVRITASGNDAQPRVVSDSSGNCGAAPGATVPAVEPALPAPQHRPRTILVKAPIAQPDAGLVREVRG